MCEVLPLLKVFQLFVELKDLSELQQALRVPLFSFFSAQIWQLLCSSASMVSPRRSSAFSQREPLHQTKMCKPLPPPTEAVCVEKEH